MNQFTEQVIKVYDRLNEIWWNLDKDDKFHQELIDAANEENQAKFSLLLQQFEDHNRDLVVKEIDRLRIITARWPLFKKQQISERINQLEQSGVKRMKAIQQAYYEIVDSNK